MTAALRAPRIWARVAAALGFVVGVATLAYALLVPLVLGTEHRQRDGAVLGGLYAAVVVLVVLLVRSAALYPVLTRSVAACVDRDPLALTDRRALYAAPRRAAGLVGLLGLTILLAGHWPLGDGTAEGRAIAANVGAVCAVLSALVLYAALRVALRPVIEALPSDPEADADLDADNRPASDRLALRVAVAIAVPAAAAALVVTLVVSAHNAAIAAEVAATSDDAFNLAVSMERHRDEPAEAVARAADALRLAGVLVATGTGSGYTVPAAPTTPSPPLWSLPIALAVGLVAAQLGRRIGRSASRDVESAASRMAVVGMEDIRSVTMHMVRPRSVPEIRDMALALDTLAATLLRMAEDQKRALSARSDAARLRSFVLASVSHDLRGPLNSVLGFAELVLSGVEGPLTPGQQESLEALARGGHDLLRLVDDLLDHARLDAARMTLERARLGVDRLVEQARASALERAKVPAREGAIVIEGEGGLSVLADEERMPRALGALCAYALLRPGSDGRVVLRTGREEGGIVVTVRGGGATPTREALAALFEPFDVAPSGARAPAGLNLAVWVARGIVELHGGRAHAEARAEGGILLTVTLPTR